MASVAPVDLPDDEAGLLAFVAEIAAELETVDRRRDELLDARRAAFVKLRSLDPPALHRVIKEAAGLRSEEAVSAVLNRARARN